MSPERPLHHCTRPQRNLRKALEPVHEAQQGEACSGFER